MREYDDELGGSEFIKVFAHATEVFKSFIRFYFALVTRRAARSTGSSPSSRD